MAKDVYVAFHKNLSVRTCLSAMERHLPYRITRCYSSPYMGECISRYSMYLSKTDGKLNTPVVL